MSDILNLLKNAVNMSGYGASKNFVGYFEKDGKYKPGLAEDAVQFFLTFFGASSDQFILASSLHANSDEIGHSGDEVEDKKDLALIEDLTGSGVLKSFSYEKQFGFDYQTDHYETAVEAAWCDIQCRPMTDYEPSDLKKLLLARMLVYGLHGHCFLHNQKCKFHLASQLGPHTLQNTTSRDGYFVSLQNVQLPSGKKNLILPSFVVRVSV